MTTEELLRAIEKAKKRDDVVRFYAHALLVECRASVDWARVNAAIKGKWKSRASLRYIKTEAWHMYEVALAGVRSGGAGGGGLGVEGDHSDAVHERE